MNILSEIKDKTTTLTTALKAIYGSFKNESDNDNRVNLGKGAVVS